MSHNYDSWRQWLLFLLVGMAPRLLWAAPMPGDPMEAISLGAMTLAGSAAEIMQNGAAIRHEGGIQTPLFGFNKKTELGFGDAMRKKSSSSNDDSDEDSDELRKKRRRRSVAAYIVNNNKYNKKAKLQNAALIAALPATRRALIDTYRLQRAPCRRRTTPSDGAGGAGGGDDGEGDVEEVGRLRAATQRRRSAAQRQRATTKAPAKKFIDNKEQQQRQRRRRRRRRRQADNELAEFIDVNDKNADAQFNEQAKDFTDRLRNTFNGIIDSMSAIVQQVKKVFSGNDNAAAKPTTQEI